MRTTTALTRLLGRYGPTPEVADLPPPDGSPATPDPTELADVVRQAVTDALHTNGARPPVRPTLTPEWRVHVTAQSGGTYTRDAVDEADARKQAALFKHGRAVVQYRLVAPWTPAAPPPPPPGGSAGDEPGRDSAA